MPLDAELWKITQTKEFPLKRGQRLRLLDYHFWLTQDNKVLYLDESNESNKRNDSWSDARVLAVNSFFKQKPTTLIALKAFSEKKWKIRPHFITVLQTEIDQCIADSKFSHDIYQTFVNNKEYWLKNPFAIPSELEQLRKFLTTYVNEELKEFIYLYFNSKYARQNYSYNSRTNGKEVSASLLTDVSEKDFNFKIVWKYIEAVNEDRSGSQIDNSKHLRGATILLLRDNLDNGALHLLKSFSLFVIGVVINLSFPRAYLKARSIFDFSRFDFPGSNI